MPQVTDEARDAWLSALSAEFGFEIKTGEPELVLADLYETRKVMADPRLENFRIIRLKGGTLWIVRKELDLKEIEKELGNAAPLP